MAKTPSANEVLAFVRERGDHVSFAELQRDLPGAAGDQGLLLAENLVLWSNLSHEVCDAVMALIDQKRIHFFPSSPLTYAIDGALPTLQRATHLYDRTTSEERMAMCQVALDAMKAAVPLGINLEELNEKLAASGTQHLNDHNDWIGLMEHSWEFRHCWDGTFSEAGRLNGPWPHIGERSYFDGYYYDPRDGETYGRAVGGEPLEEEEPAAAGPLH